MNRAVFIIVFAVVLAASTEVRGVHFKLGIDLADPLHSFVVGGNDQPVGRVWQYHAAGYVLGVHDASTFGGGVLEPHFIEEGKGGYIKPGLAIPSRINPNQLIKVVDQYFQEHPENLDMPASFLIQVALVEAWGTPEQKAQFRRNIETSWTQARCSIVHNPDSWW